MNVAPVLDNRGLPCPGRPTVLLVDDEDMVRELARQILVMSGYEVLTARDGEEALQLSSRHDTSIDLVLTDVIMPRMNGRQMFEELVRRRPGLRVIYMSGYTDGIIGDGGILPGDTNLLQKPFTIDGLIARIRAVMK